MVNYLMHSSLLHRVVMLVDLKVGLQDPDKMLIDMLTEGNQVFLRGLTKADKLRNLKQIDEKMQEVVSQVRPLGSLCVPVIHCVSAEGGAFGVFELLSNIAFHNEQQALMVPNASKHR